MLSKYAEMASQGDVALCVLSKKHMSSHCNSFACLTHLICAHKSSQVSCIERPLFFYSGGY